MSKCDFYFRVVVDNSISDDGEIYIHADGVDTKSDGSLHFFNKKQDLTHLIIAKGLWVSVNAASCLDGAPCFVEFWEGQYNSNRFGE